MPAEKDGLISYGNVRRLKKSQLDNYDRGGLTNAFVERGYIDEQPKPTPPETDRFGWQKDRPPPSTRWLNDEKKLRAYGADEKLKDPPPPTFWRRLLASCCPCCVSKEKDDNSKRQIPPEMSDPEEEDEREKNIPPEKSFLQQLFPVDADRKNRSHETRQVMMRRPSDRRPRGWNMEQIDSVQKHLDKRHKQARKRKMSRSVRNDRRANIKAWGDFFFEYQKKRNEIKT